MWHNQIVPHFAMVFKDQAARGAEFRSLGPEASFGIEKKILEDITVLLHWKSLVQFLGCAQSHFCTTFSMAFKMS